MTDAGSESISKSLPAPADMRKAGVAPGPPTDTTNAGSNLLIIEPNEQNDRKSWPSQDQLLTRDARVSIAAIMDNGQEAHATLVGLVLS